MPTMVVQKEHHGHWREKAGRRGGVLNRDRARCGLGSPITRDADALAEGVPEGRIGVTTSPRQNGCAINDEITCSNQSLSYGMEDREHEERFVQRSPGGTMTFALL